MPPTQESKRHTVTKRSIEKVIARQEAAAARAEIAVTQENNTAEEARLLLQNFFNCIDPDPTPAKPLPATYAWAKNHIR